MYLESFCLEKKEAKRKTKLEVWRKPKLTIPSRSSRSFKEDKKPKRKTKKGIKQKKKDGPSLI